MLNRSVVTDIMDAGIPRLTGWPICSLPGGHHMTNLVQRPVGNHEK